MADDDKSKNLINSSVPSELKSTNMLRKDATKKGIAAFYMDKKDYDKLEVLKPEYLKYPEAFNNYPDQIKLMRNRLIYLIIWQIGLSIFGMFYWIIRRSFIYLLINLVSIGLAITGIQGALVMLAFKLMIHCVFTISLTGSFFFFQVIDYLLVTDTTYGSPKRMSDNLLLIIFSIPYIFDCYAGIYNFMFLKQISKFNEQKKKERFNNPYSAFENLSDIEMLCLDEIPKKEDILYHINEEKKCIICCEKERDAVLNPCGHVLCCLECARKIHENRLKKATCPICREEITSIIKYRSV